MLEGITQRQKIPFRLYDYISQFKRELELSSTKNENSNLYVGQYDI
jgi:hypothetical protein